MADGFFPKSVRRQISLRTVKLLIAANDEKRIQMALSMELTGEKLVGLPDWLGNAHDAVASDIDAATIDKIFDGMNVEIYATDQSEKRMIQIPACQLKGFTVERRGAKEAPDVVFCFVCLCGFSTATWKWAGDMGGHDCFAKFDVTQMELTETAA